jgi:hypothetical protein
MPRATWPGVADSRRGPACFGNHLPRAVYESVAEERKEMIRQKLVHGQVSYPVSLTLIGAVLLLVIGLVAIFSIVSRVGPFQ